MFSATVYKTVRDDCECYDENVSVQCRLSCGCVREAVIGKYFTPGEAKRAAKKEAVRKGSTGHWIVEDEWKRLYDAGEE